MSSKQFSKLLGTIGAAASIFATPAYASTNAQGGPQSPVFDLTRGRSTLDTIDDAKANNYTFDSKADSLSWARSRAVAEKATGFHIVVSLQDKHLWAIIGQDTVLSAPVSTAKGTTLKYAGSQTYVFKTPRGVRTVLRKEADPVWQPPEWLYVETAKEYDLKIGHLGNKSRVKLGDGRILTVQDNQAGILDEWRVRQPADRRTYRLRRHALRTAARLEESQGRRRARKVPPRHGRRLPSPRNAVQGFDRHGRDARLRSHARRRHRVAVRPHPSRDEGLHLLIAGSLQRAHRVTESPASVSTRGFVFPTGLQSSSDFTA